MGYGMSRFETEPDYGVTQDFMNGVSFSRKLNEPLMNLDCEIAHLTRLRSRPDEPLCRFVRQKLPVSTVKMLASREGNYSGKGRFTPADQCHLLTRYLPVNGPWRVDKLNTRAYVSQFSADGSLFIAAFQGSVIRIYNVDNGWKVQKEILAKSLRWTITDTSLSPDQRHLVYASMSPVVHIVDAELTSTQSGSKNKYTHDPLDFSVHSGGDYSFGIFSVKFSTDGRELVAGSSENSIYVYDLEANKLNLRISAHKVLTPHFKVWRQIQRSFAKAFKDVQLFKFERWDRFYKSDVNTVCFADGSGHLIYSGSDDNLCKVWDRRCFIAEGRPAGVLMGHLEGITFLDTHGDGRYLVSNGKDQMLKLWDIRRMSSISICSKPRHYKWDYRCMSYPAQARNVTHPYDQSLATYKGHSVLRTLVRCYFSPVYSTGQKYIYTGSNDGCVYIYDLVSGALVARLEHHESTVRDCSWHPIYPILVSSSWDGVIARWEFSGKGDVPAPLN